MKIIPKAQSQGFGVYLINLTASSSPAAGEVILRKTTLNARSSRSAAAFLTSLMVMVTSAISENNFCTISARYWIVTSPSNKKSIFAWKRRKKQTNKKQKHCIVIIWTQRKCHIREQEKVTNNTVNDCMAGVKDLEGRSD